MISRMLMMAASKNPCPYGNELFVLTSTAIPLYGATLVITGTGRASNDYIWTITPNAGSSGNFGCDLTYTIPSTPALESIFAPPSVPTISFLQANLGSPNSSTLIVELISNVYPYGGIMSSGNNYPIYAGDSLRIIYYGNQFVSGWNESYFRFSSNIADCTPTPTPTPTVDPYCVSGAGSSQANGTYSYNSVSGQWEKVGTPAIYFLYDPDYDSFRLVDGTSGYNQLYSGTLYQTNPSLIIWSTVYGTPPAPTMAAGDC